MIELTKDLPEKGNAYILFGFDAEQTRPNLDPFTANLRIDNETRQVFLSDVCCKHAVRRGLKAVAEEKGLPAEAAVFYEKKDEEGNSCDFKRRLEIVREKFKIADKDISDRNAFEYCLDLPMFGYVHAQKKESGKDTSAKKDKGEANKKSNGNFNVTNAINTLFRPSTFHKTKIYWLGRNNAFPTLDKNNNIQEASGSASVDTLEYGFFLELWEINLNMLRINTREHKTIKWQQVGAKGWIELFANALWKAYTTDRNPSFTQRAQFAKFMLGWIPEGEPEYLNPAKLYNLLANKEIKSREEALPALQKIMPDYLKTWKCSKKSLFLEHKAENFNINLLG